MREIVVGTRQSKLALIQTNWVIDQLRKAGIQNKIKIKKFETKGDKILNVSLAKLGRDGIFIREIEQAMVDKEIDFAVHSMKDLPATMPEEIMIASIPLREDYRDAYIAKDNIKLMDLPKGAIIGTSSIRRSAQILAERPDVQTKWIRGPIDSRLEQLHGNNYDAIILAVAGIKRLGLGEKVITEYLPTDKFVPAIGQGALAIECRKNDDELRNILTTINDEDSEAAVATERRFIDLLKESEHAPISGYAYIDQGEIVLHVTVATTDGRTILSEVVRGANSNKVASEAAKRLIGQGALEMIQNQMVGLDK